MTKLEQCKELLGCWEQPDYRYRQILQAVFHRRISRFQEMTVLPAGLRDRLTQELGILLHFLPMRVRLRL